MSAHSQPSVGIDHPTVVPANFDPEEAALVADDRSASHDAGDPASTASTADDE